MKNLADINNYYHVHEMCLNKEILYSRKNFVEIFKLQCLHEGYR